MYVKIYHYHIPKEKVEQFLDIQERAGELYGQYIDYQTIYINSKNDETKWMEISRYQDENEYRRSMERLNEESEVHLLFDEFKSLLIGDIKEDDFFEKKQMTFRNGKKAE